MTQLCKQLSYYQISEIVITATFVGTIIMGGTYDVAVGTQSNVYTTFQRCLGDFLAL